jgi:hypothetical protein
MPTVIAPAIVSAFAAGGVTISAATAATMATAGLYIATTAASYFIQQAMAEKPETGTKLRASLGGAVDQSFIFGEKETAGSFIYRGTWGVSGKVPNGYLVNVYCLQDMRSEAVLQRVWTAKKAAMDQSSSWSIDGKNLGHPVAAFDSGGSHYLGVRIHDGTQTSADPYLRSVFGSDATRPWTSDMIGRGRTLAIVTQRYNKKEPEGEVAPVFLVRGIKLYDWRKDSTNGGSGTHRYGTYSTYEYSANPAVVMYNIMRGIYHGDEWMYGGEGWPASRFDNDAWTAAANHCDENVTLKNGDTEKRYRCGGEVALSEEPWSVIERLMKACNGRVVESGGRFKLHCGGVGTSVHSFNDDSVLASEELTGRLFPVREDIANTITGTYVEPDNGGRQKAFRPRADADLIAEDGGERKISADFEYVRSNTQAQRLAKLTLKDNRRFRTFSLALWTEGRKLEPCDVVSWTSTRFGFESKKFIVGDVSLQRDGVTVVNLREANPADADWSTLDEDSYETGVYGDIVPPAQTLSATVSSFGITDDAGNNRRPGIRIQATLDEDFNDCEALLYKVRKSASVPRVIMRGRSEGFFDPDSEDYGDVVFTDNSFLPGRAVQVNYRVKPEGDRAAAWAGWTNVTLTNARLKVQNLDAGNENDIDAIGTSNILPLSVEGRIGWTGSNNAHTWTGEDNAKTRVVNLGGPSAIINPNPSTVLLKVSGRLKADVSAISGKPGTVGSFATTVTIFSAPVSGSGTLGKAVAIYSASVIGSREVRYDGFSTKAGNKAFEDVVVDIYDGAAGEAPRRKYYAQVKYAISPGQFGTNVTGKGSIQNLTIKGSWSKR